MCRNIKPLFNFDPLATEEEIRDASLQFVKKVTGFQRPSIVNEEAFEKAIERISTVTQQLFDSLITNVEPKDREVEAKKAKERSKRRFGKIL